MCPSFSENSLSSLSVGSRGLSSKTWFVFPWGNRALGVTRTIPKRSALRWNTAVHTPPGRQGLPRDKNLLIAQPVSSHFPGKHQTLVSLRTKAELVQNGVPARVLSRTFFSLLPSIAPPFPSVETKENIL